MNVEKIILAAAEGAIQELLSKVEKRVDDAVSSRIDAKVSEAVSEALGSSVVRKVRESATRKACAAASREAKAAVAAILKDEVPRVAKALADAIEKKKADTLRTLYEVLRADFDSMRRHMAAEARKSLDEQVRNTIVGYIQSTEVQNLIKGGVVAQLEFEAEKILKARMSD